jgi:hypothetical protein
MKYKFLLTLLVICLAGNAWAQRKLKNIDDEEAEKNKALEKQYGKANNNNNNKWFFGGGFGGGFGNISSFLLLQPTVGYRFTEKTIVGGGATYIYSSFKFNNKTYSNSVYGPIAFVRQNLTESIFAQAEYQPLNYSHFDRLTLQEQRRWYQQLYVGGGYGAIPGGFIAVFYNVLFNPENQIYSSPLDIRFGFFF